MAVKGLKTSVGLRLFIIGLLSLILLIPTVMIKSLISERENRRNEATYEVTSKWGNAQNVSGPILTIPFKSYFKNDKGQVIESVQYVHFLPDDLSINGAIYPEIRYRGIYEIILYNTKLKLRGIFHPPDLEELNIPPDDVLWQDAFVAIGINDMKGIKDIIKIKWNEAELIANPGIVCNDVLASGISSPTALNSQTTDYNFSVDINLDGSEQLMFMPIGKETRVTISAKWNNPSFVGEFLPETRKIQNDAFSAEWKILHLNRNYPQRWIGNQHKIEHSAFGVRLRLPVDEYQKTMRTAKYAIMFISLTFLSFFMIEILNKKVLHPVQYLLIGLALILFYTLLLSFSEHLRFQYAYLIGSVSMSVMITAYTKSVLSNNLLTMIIAGILIILYGFLYIVLQLQDYALLLGSIGLFVILAIVMYLTRRIDWFAVWKSEAV